MKKITFPIIILFFFLNGHLNSMTRCETYTIPKMERDFLKTVEVSRKLKNILDTIFNEEVKTFFINVRKEHFNNAPYIKESLEQKGFSVFQYDGGLTCEHELLPGYVMKLSLFSCRWKHHLPNYRRIAFSHFLRKIIVTRGLYLYIPYKYAYFSDCSREGVITIEEKLIRDEDANDKQLSLEQFRSLQYLIQHAGLVDTSRTNVFFSKIGELVIVDTEPLDARDPAFGQTKELGMSCLKNNFPDEWTLYGDLEAAPPIQTPEHN